MAAQNISLNKTNPSYPAGKPGDVQAAPTVLVQWDPSFATATSLTFALTVTDNLGVTSNQATVTVKIQAKPIAVLAGPNPTNTVSAGSNIQLDGSGSTPPPGAGVTYKWTLVS
ncbi:MAG: hypothetical protein WCC87_04580 [Candidatus Korobacteraceae bacterium]